MYLKNFQLKKKTYPLLVFGYPQYCYHIQPDSLHKKLNFVEASDDAEKKWNETIITKARNMESFQEACTPGYYNNEGKPNTNPQNNSYGGGALEYFELLGSWRKNNKLKGLVTAE